MRKCRALAVTVLIGFAAVLGSPGTGFAQKGPIKVGLLVPQTGPLAANGKDMVNALQLFFEEQGYKWENPVYSRDYPPCKHC